MFKMFDQRFALNDIQSTRETIKYGISFIIHSCIRRLLKEVPFYHVYQCVRIRWKTATLRLTYALCTYNSLHARIRSTSSSQQIYRMVSNIHQIIHLSWELTYPLPKHFQRCIFSFPKVGYVIIPWKGRLPSHVSVGFLCPLLARKVSSSAFRHHEVGWNNHQQTMAVLLWDNLKLHVILNSQCLYKKENNYPYWLFKEMFLRYLWYLWFTVEKLIL